MLGDAAYYLQEFVTGLPPQTIVAAETVLIINLALYVLAFWFRGMSNRNS